MKLEITKASEVQVKSVEWLWYPYIPYPNAERFSKEDEAEEVKVTASAFS